MPGSYTMLCFCLQQEPHVQLCDSRSRSTWLTTSHCDDLGSVKCTCCLADSTSDSTWPKEREQERLKEMYRAAQTANRLLKRNPPPSDPTQSLPTPTAPQWEAIKACLNQVSTSQDFFSGLKVKRGPSEAALDELRKELLQLPFYLIAGHLPNLELDVSFLTRSVFCYTRGHVR